MWRFAILATAVTLISGHHMPDLLAAWSQPFHSACLTLAPDVLSRDVLQSLICGSPLSSSVDDAAWKQLGLVHLLVVSGGHLVIVDLVLTSVFKWTRVLAHAPRFSNSVRWSALIAMVLANQFAPPIWRAFLAMALREPLRRIGWSSSQRGLVAFWLSLAFVNSRGEMLSLGLSAICAWILTIPKPELLSSSNSHQPPANELLASLKSLASYLIWALLVQSLIWWGTWPLIAPMGAPHPMATASNILLAPILGIILVPAALLALFLPFEWAQSLWIFIWTVTQNCIHQLSRALPQVWPKERISTLELSLLGIGLCSILALVILLERTTGRESNVGRRPLTQLALILLLMVAALVSTRT